VFMATGRGRAAALAALVPSLPDLEMVVRVKKERHEKTWGVTPELGEIEDGAAAVALDGKGGKRR
jgi:hypothetical protein